MFQLVYASAALVPFTPDDLRLLLARARVANASKKVTGMLLYHSGSFLQVLEGPQAGVEHIFGSIERDPRHHQIKVRLRQATERREFPDWTMGFIDVSRWIGRPGMVDFHRIPEVATAPTAGQRYLRLFHQGLCRQAMPA
jgi:Sensors of blue-light using FAD